MKISIYSTVSTTALSLLKGAGVQTNAVFQRKAQNTQKNPAQTQEDVLLSKLAPKEREKFEQAQNTLKQTLQQLQSGSKNVNEERKAAAAQRIAQIKAQLQMLRMLAATDPKAAARQAAQLARELAAAVRDYSGSSGSTGGVPVEAGAATSSATATVATAASPDAVAGAAGQTENKDATVADSDTTTSTVNTDGTTPDGNDKTDAEKKDEQRAQFNESLKSQIAEIQQKAGKIQADVEFKKSVREIAAQLRSIIEQGKRRAEHDKKDDGFSVEAQQGLNALRDVEHSLNDMGTAAIGDIGSVDVSTDVATTTVDITV